MTFEQCELFEQWRPVVRYEGLYEVSNWGRVRSVARSFPHNRNKRRAYIKPGRILVQTRLGHGYLALTLVPKEGNKRTHPVAPLVAEAFLGPRPFGKQIDHIDGNKQNNYVLNLRYVTPRENLTAKNHVRVLPNGEKHWNCKLSDTDVVEIRRLHLEGMPHGAIAKFFGCARQTIGKIVRKQRRVK